MKTEQHLNEDHILRAIADEMHLPKEIRQHLLNCADCRQKKQETENGFHRLGEAVRQLSPLPKRRPRLQPETRQKMFMFRRPLLAAVVSVLLVLMVGWWVVPLKPHFDTVSRYTAQSDLWEDEKLMSEISKLTENPLPESYTVLISESYTDTEDDYMEYLVPSADDQPMLPELNKNARYLTKKGGLLC